MTESSFALNQQELEFSRSFGTKLKELANNFLDIFQLSHAFLGKDYFDGHFFNISSDIIWKEITIEHNYHKDFCKNFLQNIKIKSEKTLFFMWERGSGNQTKVLDHIYDHSEAISGFNILIPHKDHFENYGFASRNPLLQVYNNLPSREELEMFCLYLREELLNSANLSQPAFGITGQKLTPNRDAKAYYHIPIPDSFSFVCNGTESKLSRREVVCLGLLSKGHAQKGIAQIMTISPRTVEFHLNHIKKKFNNPSKMDLITSFNTSPLSSINSLLLLETE